MFINDKVNMSYNSILLFDNHIRIWIVLYVDSFQVHDFIFNVRVLVGKFYLSIICLFIMMGSG